MLPPASGCSSLFPTGCAGRRQSVVAVRCKELPAGANRRLQRDRRAAIGFLHGRRDWSRRQTVSTWRWHQGPATLRPDADNPHQLVQSSNTRP